MTTKKVLAVVGVLALITLIGVLAVNTVFAQTETPSAQTTPTPCKPFGGRGFGFWGGGWTTSFDAVAEALNLTPAQLFEQLHSGKTLEEIATAQGVDLSKVQEAVNASRIQAMKDAIAQAVKDGKITQEQADWLLQGLDKGYLGKGRDFGFGFGFGHGMRGGMRGFGKWGPAPAPTAPASGTSS